MFNLSISHNFFKRSLFFFFIWRRLLFKYLRLRRVNSILQSKVDSSDGILTRKLAEKDLEIKQLRSKIELKDQHLNLVRAEMTDKVLQAVELMGTRYAETKIEDKLRDLDNGLSVIDATKPESVAPPQTETFKNLAGSERAMYSAEYESELQSALAQGLTAKQFQTVWLENEERIVHEIQDGEIIY